MPLSLLPASKASQTYLNSFVIPGYTKCQQLSRKAYQLLEKHINKNIHTISEVF